MKVCDRLANAGPHTQQSTQTSGGAWLPPTPAPVCTSAACKLQGRIPPANDGDTGPCIPNDTRVHADCAHLSSTLHTYFKNTTTSTVIGMTY